MLFDVITNIRADDYSLELLQTRPPNDLQYDQEVYWEVIRKLVFRCQKGVFEVDDLQQLSVSEASKEFIAFLSLMLADSSDEFADFLAYFYNFGSPIRDSFRHQHLKKFFKINLREMSPRQYGRTLIFNTAWADLKNLLTPVFRKVEFTLNESSYDLKVTKLSNIESIA